MPLAGKLLPIVNTNVGRNLTRCRRDLAASGLLLTERVSNWIPELLTGG
jgi:hypothetical protein